MLVKNIDQGGSQKAGESQVAQERDLVGENEPKKKKKNLKKQTPSPTLKNALIMKAMREIREVFVLFFTTPHNTFF